MKTPALKKRHLELKNLVGVALPCFIWDIPSGNRRLPPSDGPTKL
jgi:hypothetical protein